MKVLNKEEKKQVIENFEDVKNAVDDGTTHQFTKGGWRKFYMTKYDYIQLDDGKLVEIEKETICRTIYYDDTLENPLKGDAFAAFVAYNMSYSFDDSALRWDEERTALRENGCCSGAYPAHPKIKKAGHDTYYIAWTQYYKDYEQDTDDELTDSEADQLVEYVKERKEAFKKRLATYYKRYGATSKGYWANR